VVWNAGGLRTLPKGFRAIAAGAHGAWSAAAALPARRCQQLCRL